MTESSIRTQRLEEPAAELADHGCVIWKRVEVREIPLAPSPISLLHEVSPSNAGIAVVEGSNAERSGQKAVSGAFRPLTIQG